MTIKERVESQIIAELSCDPYLAAMIPVKQNADTKPKMPYIAIVATPGKEYNLTSGIYRLAVAVEIRFSAKKSGQTVEVLDGIVERCRDKLREAQLRGEYGLTMDGEAERFEGDTIRVRIINISVIAA